MARLKYVPSKAPSASPFQSSKTLHDREGIPYWTGADPSRNEQSSLPPEFRVGYGCWPVAVILNSRGVGSKRKLLVDWAVYPKIKQCYKPLWVSRRLKTN